MAVALRLQRIGKHKQAYYRVVAADRRRAAKGKPIEILGSYNPRAEKASEKIVVDQERLAYWLKVGARPSETLASLLKAAGRKPGEAPAAKAEKAEKTA